jgi:hypothetical protein
MRRENATGARIGDPESSVICLLPREEGGSPHADVESPLRFDAIDAHMSPVRAVSGCGHADNLVVATGAAQVAHINHRS